MRACGKQARNAAQFARTVCRSITMNGVGAERRARNSSICLVRPMSCDPAPDAGRNATSDKSVGRSGCLVCFGGTPSWGAATSNVMDSSLEAILATVLGHDPGPFEPKQLLFH